jgi:hypothetical protein
MKLTAIAMTLLSFLMSGCKRVDHSKDKFCGTLPAQCTSPASQTAPADSGIIRQENRTMNALSTITLISELLQAFEAVFPKAQTLHKVNAVTSIVGPTLIAATESDPGTVNTTVQAIGATLPAVVAAVQAVQAASAAPTPDRVPAIDPQAQPAPTTA